MVRLPPGSTRTAQPFPPPTLVRVALAGRVRADDVEARQPAGQAAHQPGLQALAPPGGQHLGAEGVVAERRHVVHFDRRPVAYRIQILRLLQAAGQRSEEHTSELQSLMRISYAVFCLQKKKKT